MPYTFELTFTGLCIFTFVGDKRHPSEINALLVDTLGHPVPHDKHLPYLGYRPENLKETPTPPHRLVPGPDGVQTALQSLAGKSLLQILPPGGAQTLSPIWRPNTIPSLPEHPRTVAEEDWLDWAMALKRMNPETPRPDSSDPYGGLKPGSITARIQMKNGNLKAKTFLKVGASGDYATWDFKVPAGATIQATHAMASFVLLSLNGLPDGNPVIIQGASFKVVLQQAATGESLVRASITNLPEFEAPQPRPPYLEHFKHFYGPVDFPPPPPKLRMPHPHQGTITTSNTFCPPTTHTLAE
jgi:hypothetical protein